jgi:hypothetical protein
MFFCVAVPPQAFCLRNSANQDVLFPHLSLFTEQLPLNVGAEDTITALVLENRRLCNCVPDDVFWELAAQVCSLAPTAVLETTAACHFTRVVWVGSQLPVLPQCSTVCVRRQIERSGRRPQLLRPFVAFMRCGDVPIKKNQTRTLQVLIQPSLTRPMLLYNTPDQKHERRALIQVSGVARSSLNSSPSVLLGGAMDVILTCVASLSPPPPLPLFCRGYLSAREIGRW